MAGEIKNRIVVIGGVAAGMSAASQAKRRSPNSEVFVLEKGEYISYGACGMPYNIMDPEREETDLFVLSPEEAISKRKINLKTGFEAKHIDPEGQKVYATEIKTGKEYSLSYDSLVIATGARAFIPPIQGVDKFKGIFVLRDIYDMIKIKHFLMERKPKKGLIVGAGYIGLEMAHSLKERGLDVVVIEKMPEILSDFGRIVQENVEEKLKSKNIPLYKNCSALYFEGDKDNNIAYVETEAGRFDAEIVILATGIVPNTEIAVKAGILTFKNGAIITDTFQRTNIENIYAAGDCATHYHRILKKNYYLPLGTTANKQGRIAGANAAGLNIEFAGIVGTAVFKFFDLEIGRTGLTKKECIENGFDVGETTIKTRTRAHGYPDSKIINVRYLYDRTTGKFLGASMIGGEGVAKRIDVLATALYADLTIDDISNLDLSYSPPFAPVWDPILVCANVSKKSIKTR